MCRTHVQGVPVQGQGHRPRSNLCSLDFVSAPYLLNALKAFLKTWVKCSPYRVDVQNPRSSAPVQGQGHIPRSNLCSLDFVSARYLLNALKFFLKTWVKCSPYRDDVKNPRSRCARSRSRSQIKVKPMLPGFNVRSISAQRLEWFSSNLCQMFALSTRCATPMFQACLLKVKITVQGQWFKAWISCPLHNS